MVSSQIVDSESGCKGVISTWLVVEWLPRRRCRTASERRPYGEDENVWVAAIWSVHSTSPASTRRSRETFPLSEPMPHRFPTTLRSCLFTKVPAFAPHLLQSMAKGDARHTFQCSLVGNPVTLPKPSILSSTS